MIGVSQVEYDDAGFIYFIYSIGFCVFFSLTVNIIIHFYNIITVKITDRKKLKKKRKVLMNEKLISYYDCDSSSSELHLLSFFIKFVTFVIISILMYYLYSQMNENTNIQTFDPWDILGISEGKLGDKEIEKK